jgi:hypothetical protein
MMSARTSSGAIVLKANYGGNEKIGAGAVHSLRRGVRPGFVTLLPVSMIS